MRSIVRSMLTALALGTLLVGAQPASAADKATLLVDLTTDDVWTAQMGLAIAREYVRTIHAPAVVFLNVRPVALADSTVPRHTGALAKKDFHSLLREPIGEGVKVSVRGECTKQAGLSVDNRIEGVEIGGKALLERLADPNTNAWSY